MNTESVDSTPLSPWWRRTVVMVMLLGFSMLGLITVKTYQGAPPIPDKVVDESGQVLFTGDDIKAGQEVFLKYGLMEHGSLWGHGAYLGPDYTAEYLHRLAETGLESLAISTFKADYKELPPAQQAVLRETAKTLLKQNRFDTASGQLTFSSIEAASYQVQAEEWKTYFAGSQPAPGLPKNFIRDEEELKRLNAYFAWATWATVAIRPGTDYSYTNNWPYEPLVGNVPTASTYLWSALSLITLLGGLGLVLFIFGKFDYLGWGKGDIAIQPSTLQNWVLTPSQKVLGFYFLVVALLFLAQTSLGGALAHYRVEPGAFYGVDLAALLPFNLARTWHLQLAIFWIATAWVAGGLFLAPIVANAFRGGSPGRADADNITNDSEDVRPKSPPDPLRENGQSPYFASHHLSNAYSEPKGQKLGVIVLLGALALVVFGSLFGEMAGIRNLLGNLWFWIGHQGSEYLDLGRFWQLLLAAGLAFWLFLMFRALRPGMVQEGTGLKGELTKLFFYASVAIPVFYVPALFYGKHTNFAVIDNWRFWIIHLWVEGFFELFATVLVAVIFVQMGIVRVKTAIRLVYLDAILYLTGGILGTGHHWYFTGQGTLNMGLAACFSAMEVIPLTLLTLDGWDFIKLKNAGGAVHPQAEKHIWAIRFLIAVGIWNFIGAGVFGFLINLPIVSYFEMGTTLTPNHGHAAMFGVFGFLALAVMLFCLRASKSDRAWKAVEPYIRTSFWGLNVGLGLMILLDLFPGGVIQLWDVLTNGYWHARRLTFLMGGTYHALEWARMVADLVFLLVGAVPLAFATCKLVVKRDLEGA